MKIAVYSWDLRVSTVFVGKQMYAVPTAAKNTRMNDAADRVVVLTVEKAHEIFHEFHSSAIVGHTGMRRTIENVSRCFKWRNMTKHLAHWVSD